MINKERVWRQIDQIWVAIDQLFNTLTMGWADETFSSRCWRNRNRFPFNILFHVVNGLFFNKNHCEQAFNSERIHDDLPPELRK